MFKRNCDRHNFNTRYKDKLAVIASRLHKVTKSFQGLCVRFYNKVPVEIQNIPLNKFKIIIKTKLCAKAYYKISDYLDEKNPWQ